MKTALYIEDGLLQVVLAPETDQEKAILSLVEKKEKVGFYRGSFYECQGGWVRRKDSARYSMGWDQPLRDESLIIVLREPPPAPPEEMLHG